MTMRRVFWITSLLGCLAACARNDESLYLVGSTSTGVPFTFLDVPSNAPRGAMVDLVSAVARDAGFPVEVRLLPFSSLIPSLTSGRIRLIAAAMVMTDARRKIIAFSDPVYRYGEGLVVPATDAGSYVSLEELRGRVVGAQVGTIYVEPLESSGLFPEVKVYDSLADMLRDVAVGRLGAGFGDYPILAYHLAQGGDPDVRLVKSYEPRMEGEIGIGLRKGDTELLKRVNESLERLKANGTIDRILTEWKLR
jgi:polar amino acid transport system substrate-binding protein